MTLAPEVTSPDVIKLLLDKGIIIAAGHSNASFEEAVKGFKNGISMTTHLFNAMSPLHHRDTGLPGATFQTNNVYASIIADGIHVDYETVSIAKKIMGERLFLITDAVEENLSGSYVHVKSEDRFTLPDGTLSGSRLTLLQAVKNCMQHAGISLEEAIRMATVYPAKVTETKDKGSLHAGSFADFIILDENMNLEEVYLNGLQISF